MKRLFFAATLLLLAVTGSVGAAMAQPTQRVKRVTHSHPAANDPSTLEPFLTFDFEYDPQGRIARVRHWNSRGSVFIAPYYETDTHEVVWSYRYAGDTIVMSTPMDGYDVEYSYLLKDGFLVAMHGNEGGSAEFEYAGDRLSRTTTWHEERVTKYTYEWSGGNIIRMRSEEYERFAEADSLRYVGDVETNTCTYGSVKNNLNIDGEWLVGWRPFRESLNPLRGMSSAYLPVKVVTKSDYSGEETTTWRYTMGAHGNPVEIIREWPVTDASGAITLHSTTTTIEYY